MWYSLSWVIREMRIKTKWKGISCLLHSQKLKAKWCCCSSEYGATGTLRQCCDKINTSTRKEIEIDIIKYNWRCTYAVIQYYHSYVHIWLRETSLQRYQVMYIVVRINLVIITKQNTQISINRMNSGIFIQWNAI